MPRARARSRIDVNVEVMASVRFGVSHSAAAPGLESSRHTKLIVVEPTSPEMMAAVVD
jgi:hypothetical protein